MASQIDSIWSDGWTLDWIRNALKRYWKGNRDRREGQSQEKIGAQLEQQKLREKNMEKMFKFYLANPWMAKLRFDYMKDPSSGKQQFKADHPEYQHFGDYDPLSVPFENSVYNMGTPEQIAMHEHVVKQEADRAALIEKIKDKVGPDDYGKKRDLILGKLADDSPRRVMDPMFDFQTQLNAAKRRASIVKVQQTNARYRVPGDPASATLDRANAILEQKLQESQTDPTKLFDNDTKTWMTRSMDGVGVLENRRSNQMRSWIRDTYNPQTGERASRGLMLDALDDLLRSPGNDENGNPIQPYDSNTAYFLSRNQDVQQMLDNNFSFINESYHELSPQLSHRPIGSNYAEMDDASKKAVKAWLTKTVLPTIRERLPPKEAAQYAAKKQQERQGGAPAGATGPDPLEQARKAQEQYNAPQEEMEVPQGQTDLDDFDLDATSDSIIKEAKDKVREQIQESDPLPARVKDYAEDPQGEGFMKYLGGRFGVIIGPDGTVKTKDGKTFMNEAELQNYLKQKDPVNGEELYNGFSKIRETVKNLPPKEQKKYQQEVIKSAEATQVNPQWDATFGPTLGDGLTALKDAGIDVDANGNYLINGQPVEDVDDVIKWAAANKKPLTESEVNALKDVEGYRDGKTKMMPANVASEITKHFRPPAAALEAPGQQPAPALTPEQDQQHQYPATQREAPAVSPPTQPTSGAPQGNTPAPVQPQAPAKKPPEPAAPAGQNETTPSSAG